MTGDARRALTRLLNAFENHFDIARDGDEADDAALEAAELALRDAFFTYDDILFTQLGVELPFDILDEIDEDDYDEVDEDYDEEDYDEEDYDEEDYDEDDDFIEVDDCNQSRTRMRRGVEPHGSAPRSYLQAARRYWATSESTSRIGAGSGSVYSRRVSSCRAVRGPMRAEEIPG